MGGKGNTYSNSEILSIPILTKRLLSSRYWLESDMFRSVTSNKTHLKKLAEKLNAVFMLTCTKFGNISQVSVACEKAEICQYLERKRGEK